MSLNTSVSVRFEEELWLRLQRVASRSGLTPTDLARRACTEFIERVERDGQISIVLKEDPVKYRAKK